MIRKSWSCGEKSPVLHPGYIREGKTAMIYMDNAATTFPKPPETEEAMLEAIHTLGNAGRGAHSASLSASRLLFETRAQLAQLFHAEDPSCIAFTQNTTQGLNTAIDGLFKPGDHVITTACEHNSVLRPLYRMQAKGMEVTILPADRKGRIDYNELEKVLQPNTRAVITTHASNVTGNVTDLKKVSAFTRRHNLLFIVDAAQTAGVLPIDVQRMYIDVLCFPGHKGLYGPQGTGGIYVRRELRVRPLMVGGSGVHSFDREHPGEMPTALEAGTMNGHGIAGLSGGLEFLKKTGLENIRLHEEHLARRFYEKIRRIPGVTLYGDFSSYEDKKECRDRAENPGRVATIALNLADLSSAEAADLLSADYGIEVLAGAHCAPLMHEALGTKKRGAVRFSFSWFTTEEEIDLAAQAIQSIVSDAG